MKKTVLTILLLAAVMGLLGGCAADALYFDKAVGSVSAEAYNDAVSEKEGLSVSTLNDSTLSTGRKLIRTVELRVETATYDRLIEDVEAQTALVGGYTESVNADMRYYSASRYATLVIRVPVDRLDDLVNTLGELSNVVYRSENQRDITTTYVDTESHRDALRIEQERLLSLLEKAESLTDVLEIESRLTDVRYELESIESQLCLYDNQVDYATVTLYIEEVSVLTDTQEKGFWQKIGDGFLNSLKRVWSGAKSVFSYTIIALPYLLVLAVFATLALIIVRLCVKKRRARTSDYDGHGQREEH